MSRIWQFDGEINAVVESCACVPNIQFPDNQASPRALEGLPFLVKGADPPGLILLVSMSILSPFSHKYIVFARVCSRFSVSLGITRTRAFPMHRTLHLDTEEWHCALMEMTSYSPSQNLNDG